MFSVHAESSCCDFCDAEYTALRYVALYVFLLVNEFSRIAPGFNVLGPRLEEILQEQIQTIDTSIQQSQYAEVKPLHIVVLTTGDFRTFAATTQVYILFTPMSIQRIICKTSWPTSVHRRPRKTCTLTRSRSSLFWSVTVLQGLLIYVTSKLLILAYVAPSILEVHALIFR